MEYTNLILFLLGVLGMLMHNLRKIAGINKRTKGGFKASPFLKAEWPSIAISMCLIAACVLGKTEIKKLDQAGEYLGLAFLFIGYGGQSLFFSFFSRTEKRLKEEQ